jgi:hypothetical protein
MRWDVVIGLWLVMLCMSLSPLMLLPAAKLPFPAQVDIYRKRMQSEEMNLKIPGGKPKNAEARSR